MENNGTFYKTKIPSLKTSKKKKNSSKIDNFFKHEEEYRRESQLQKQIRHECRKQLRTTNYDIFKYKFWGRFNKMPGLV